MGPYEDDDDDAGYNHDQEPDDDPRDWEVDDDD